MRLVEGAPVGRGVRIGIVASRFNASIVDGLIAGAVDLLREQGVADDSIQLVRVPGALELAPVVRKLAGSGEVDGVVALGCVIRGETAHFEHVGRETASGLSRVALETGFPLGLGILTVDTLEQARIRAGLDPDPGESKEEGDRHRGREAAMACLEMVDLYPKIGPEKA